MTTKTIRNLLAALTAVVVALALGACGGDESSSGGGGGGGGQSSGSSASAIKPIPSAKGKTITMGSKNFAEQYILGNIYSQALEAAGYTVKKDLNLGSEQIAYKGVKSGQIDAYPEYTGTALTSFYDVKTDDVPRDEDEAYDLTKTKAQQDGVQALPRTPFNNPYLLTSTKAVAQKAGNPKTISELMAKNPKLSISGFPECRQRADCLLGFKRLYGYKGEFVSSEGKFADIDQGRTDLLFGFGTDGEFTLNKYATYEDDKKLFPPANISLLMSEKAAKTLGPEGLKVLADVQKNMDQKVMRELNSRATLEKQKPEEIAAAYLKQFGYVK